jgi:hypothetical protein
VSEPSNLDVLTWFGDDERAECPACNERARATHEKTAGSFCLACGAVWHDGRRLGIEPLERLPRPTRLRAS